jgi:hypothetical protein
LPSPPAHCILLPLLCTSCLFHVSATPKALPAGDLLGLDVARAQWKRECEILQLLEEDERKFIRIYGQMYGIPEQKEDFDDFEALGEELDRFEL